MSDAIHSSDSVISYVTWLFVLCWRCRKLRSYRCRSRGLLSKRKFTQPLLVEIKGDEAFATGDCRNPKNLSSISHSLWWLSTHTHTHTHTHITVLENVFIYFRTLGVILYYRALMVVNHVLHLLLPSCTVLAIVYRFKNKKT